MGTRGLAPDGTMGFWNEGDKVKGGNDMKQIYILRKGQWKKAKHKNRPEDGSNRLKVNA